MALAGIKGYISAPEALLIREEVRGLLRWPVAAGWRSRGQPDPRGGGEGGSSPDKAGTCPVLPDGAGLAGVAGMSTRGTGA
jgi:hypothetical protein